MAEPQDNLVDEPLSSPPATEEPVSTDRAATEAETTEAEQNPAAKVEPRETLEVYMQVIREAATDDENVTVIRNRDNMRTVLKQTRATIIEIINSNTDLKDKDRKSINAIIQDDSAISVGDDEKYTINDFKERAYDTPELVQKTEKLALKVVEVIESARETLRQRYRHVVESAGLNKPPLVKKRPTAITKTVDGEEGDGTEESTEKGNAPIKRGWPGKTWDAIQWSAGTAITPIVWTGKKLKKSYDKKGVLGTLFTPLGWAKAFDDKFGGWLDAKADNFRSALWKKR